MNKEVKQATEKLFEVISKLETPEECAAFFDDVCTVRELQDMAQRLDAAIMLSRGSNYREIGEEIGLSTATISRVSRCLNFGSGGYRNAMAKLGVIKDE